MASDLESIQRFLYRLITAPEGVAQGLRDADLPAPGRLEAIVCGDERLSAAQRLTIYADAYFYRLLDCLKEDFPTTLTVLGADDFRALVSAYLAAYPPSNPSVFYVGRLLGEFLHRHPFRERWAFIAELAQLERAVIEVFHGPDVRPLDAVRMRAISPAEWASIHLHTHPALEILDCEWKVNELMGAVKEERRWSDLPRGPVSILVWRQSGTVYYRELERAERHAIGAVSASSGASFATICDVIAASTQGDAVPTINRLLTRWLADGILISVPVGVGQVMGGY